MCAATALWPVACAPGYEVIYDEAENTTADLLDGKITFHQYITPYTPAEDIEDVIEFDPDALTTALS